MRTASLLAALLGAGVAFLPSPGHAAAAASGLCETAAGDHSAPPYLAVVSAFPAEIAPLVAATQVDGTVQVDGRQYYMGRLDGVSVILGLTGIGIVNARNRTESLLANFELAGVVMSGVAGSPHRIADVVVPTEWVESDVEGVLRVNRALFALARRAGKSLAPLEKCTPVPPHGANPSTVCLPFDPELVFGKQGTSGDDFGDTAVPCAPGSNDLFGCDLPAPGAAAKTPEPEVVDMETAAVARLVIARGLPFLGVRAVSDGAGDPLGDRGFPAQFADYYVLAARNAGAVTRAVVAQLGELAGDRSARGICRLLAKQRWRAAARRIRARHR